MIKKLIHQIANEFETAEEYMDCANHHEGEERDIYRSLAKEELNHAERLMHLGHMKSERGTLSDNCKIIWEYEKEKFSSRLIKDKAEYSLLT